MGSEEGSEIYVNIKISEETKEDPSVAQITDVVLIQVFSGPGHI